MVTDSFVNKDVLLDDVVILLSDFMKDKEYHKSTPRNWQKNYLKIGTLGTMK